MIYSNEITYNQNPLIPDGQKYKYIKVDSGAVVPAGNTAALEATDSLDIKTGTVIESGATFTASIVAADTVAVPPEGQYLYDEAGNLVRDNVEGTTIDWTPYGKVRTVVKDNGDTLKFAYDGSGNRILKQVKTEDSTMTTHYIRDASGNVMATYQNTELAEQNIFGSSRIGQYHGETTEDGKLKLGLKRYELTNHLGNVMAVITDRINIISDDTMSSGGPPPGGGPNGGADPDDPNNGDDPFSTNSRILADVVSVNDYYPFGLNMPGRSFSTSSYAYGFNGKRKDDNGEWGANTHYDYGFRIYNPAIAKFLSVDPLTAEYPWYTPYQFAGNTPIAAIDLDGLEEKIVSVKGGKIVFELKSTDFKPIVWNKIKRTYFLEYTKAEEGEDYVWEDGFRKYTMGAEGKDQGWYGPGYGTLIIDVSNAQKVIKFDTYDDPEIEGTQNVTLGESLESAAIGFDKLIINPDPKLARAEEFRSSIDNYVSVVTLPISGTGVFKGANYVEKIGAAASLINNVDDLSGNVTNNGNTIIQNNFGYDFGTYLKVGLAVLGIKGTIGGFSYDPISTTIGVGGDAKSAVDGMNELNNDQEDKD